MSKIRKRLIKLSLVICTLFAIAMAVNWFMTYKLEDTLRKRLRLEISKATDGFYDFSYDKIEVGLFSGELVIKGLALHPDSATFEQTKLQNKLPNEYFDVHIDTLNFGGINLTWLFDYRTLTFEKFVVNQPNIKITSPHKSHVRIKTDSLPSKSIYDEILSYFDKIQAKNIFIERGQVEYILEDSLNTHYKLEDFRFASYNFVIDEASKHKDRLLFSENFEFLSSKPQVIYDSEHFSLNINNVNLSTIDSTVHIGGVHLEPKAELWSNRFSHTGSCVDTKVEDVLLDGISLSRKGTANFLDVSNFSITQPQIEYFSVAKPNKSRRDKPTNKEQIWSLYSITSPIFERISIKEIGVKDAKLQYSQTKEETTDIYTLNNLDFRAKGFQVDSLSHQYNFFLYVQDFLIDADSISGNVPSKNGTVDIGKLYLNSEENLLRITDIKLAPLKTRPENSYTSGSIKEIEISGLDYDEGLDADMVRIKSPQVNISLGNKSKPEAKKKSSNKEESNVIKVFDAIAPFISYFSVKDIRISDGRALLIDNKDNNKYRLNNLDFYAKNFYLDKETSRLREEFFRWDEYSLRFRDFDNLTPDKKYRIQIEEGDFDSVTGNMLLRDLKVTPEEEISGSYIRIATPYVSLLGLRERALRERKIAFKTFILDSPVIELVKDEDSTAKAVNQQVNSIGLLQLISFDLLTIPSPSFYFYDVPKESSLQVQAIQAHVDSFRWELNKHLKIDNLIVESPYISLVEGKKVSKASNKKQEINIASFGDVDVRRLNIRKPILKIKKPDSYLDLSAENYLLRSFHWSHQTKSILEIGEFDLRKPNVYYAKEENEKAKDSASAPLTREEVLKMISTYANEAKLGRINIDSLNLRLAKIGVDGSKWTRRLNNTTLLIENLYTNRATKKLNIEELAFRTYDINYPIMDSFYTVRIGDLGFSNREGRVSIKKIHLDPNYPKFDFAYLHPKNKDWFNIKTDSLNLYGVDASKLLSDTLLKVEKLKVDGVTLENLKNQKIKIEHNIMPLLYEEFQRLPLKYYISDVDIRDFTVLYEELPRNGYHTARIPFANMNGRIKDFTNIQRGDGKFYTLHADGLAMGTAPFWAKWKIPVDSTNDKFYLTAEIKDMDMRDFNQLVRPMAPAYVKSGRLHKLYLHTEASSIGAVVDMEFAYDSLYVVVLKNMESENKHKLLTHVVNRWGIEKQNLPPNLYVAHDSIVRNPYHSNFNYFWQIIQPPLVKSVGVSEEKQNFVHNLGVIWGRVKRFFGGGKKEEKKKE